MASQDDSGIPLEHAPDGVSYKLFELPPALVEQLESDNPPVLSLEPTPVSARLRSPNKVYTLRQKNTSNALMLLRPTDAPADSSDIPLAQLTVVATIHQTIEVVDGVADPQAEKSAKGKWHERFGRSR